MFINICPVESGKDVSQIYCCVQWENVTVGSQIGSQSVKTVAMMQTADRHIGNTHLAPITITHQHIFDQNIERGELPSVVSHKPDFVNWEIRQLEL